ncbi:MAG: hypothetical protein BroJett015_45320 [Chloroflexota bacterium]|nr:MAG: hypothetical protein BroJett015_45320 [Chloroflexota bacterium]
MQMTQNKIPSPANATPPTPNSNGLFWIKLENLDSEVASVAVDVVSGVVSLAGSMDMKSCKKVMA